MLLILDTTELLNVCISDNGIDPDSMVLATVNELKSIFPKLGEFLNIKAVFLATYTKVMVFYV